MKDTALGEGLVTNIALWLTSAIFATRLSPRAVYFIQTGGSALSNTYYQEFIMVRRVSNFAIPCVK